MPNPGSISGSIVRPGHSAFGLQAEDLLHVLARELEPHARTQAIRLINHDNAEGIKRPHDSVGIILRIDPRAAAGLQECQGFYRKARSFSEASRPTSTNARPAAIKRPVTSNFVVIAASTSKPARSERCPGRELKPVFPGRNRDSEPLGLPFPPDGASQLALNRHLAKFVAKPGMDRGLKQFLTSGFLPAYR